MVASVEYARLMGLPETGAKPAGAGDDIGVLAPGKQADIVAMAGDPIADITATEK